MGPARPDAASRMARTLSDHQRSLDRLDPRRDPRIARTAGGLALAIIALGLLRATDSLTGIRETLVAIGFDEPRAILISDLIAAGLAGAATALVSGSRRLPAIVGAVLLAGVFGPRFLATVNADAAAHPVGTQVDLGGVARSVAAFVVAGGAAAWTAGLVAIEARSGALAALAAARAPRRNTTSGRRDLTRRLAVLGGVFVIALGTLPTLSDMLNFEPDADVLAGAPLATPGPSQVVPQPSSADPVTITPIGSPIPMPSTAPWAAWAPTGHGTMLAPRIAAPWVGGVRSTIAVDVYLPPGYRNSGRSYPAIYVVPWAGLIWKNGGHVIDTLDSLIDSGAIPASIVVWTSSSGGPWGDSECIDSFDGREHFETFISKTLPAYVDTNFRTIRSAAARSILGASEGGYCAADLLVRHPDVFGNGASFSGYYTAAPNNPQTKDAWRVFGGSSALLAAHSPLTVVGTLPAATRARIEQILVGNPVQPFYGPQMVAYAAALRAAGVQTTVIDDPLGHSWTAVGNDFGTVLRIIADAEAQRGVFA